MNLSEYNDKPIRFLLGGSPSGVSIIQHRLGVVSGGQTSLATVNAPSDPYENITWTITDLTSSLNPSDFTINFPRATLTMLRIERPPKTLPDGVRVTLSGKSVTAVYPQDGYLYIEEDDRSFGLRVAGDCSGISIGDRITVTGVIGTLKPDGSTASERCIFAGTVARISSGAESEPLFMTCRSVGGDKTLGSSGVNNPCGPNNIGLLVCIAGRVTNVIDGTRMYVDDGSNVVGTNGNVGVLVICPDTSGYKVGEIITVTGVVEGHVPSGWSTNQRCIRARTSDDIILRVPVD